ncbi:MAG: hypothetical protein JWQ07_2948, partial [Ramlibacter sp.]|nr:hypothetical protein [Ramlibacter sp.]
PAGTMAGGTKTHRTIYNPGDALNTTHALAAASVALMLAACGGGGSEAGGPSTTDNSVTRGSLQFNPPLRVTALTAAEFTARLNGSASGQQLLAIAGVPKCGVNFHYIQYGTVGGQGEPATASGALMVPTGTDPACTGARPIVLYAHGTTTDRGYNIANILDASLPGASEGSLVGALYAAQGFTVVAPNYVGYDASSSSYHPFLNGEQQSKDMIDALTAARKALPAVGAIDSGKLLVTGYSEGGYVTMATHRALQAGTSAHRNELVRVVAGAGPYNVAATMDQLLAILRRDYAPLGQLLDPGFLRFLGDEDRRHARDLLMLLSLGFDAEVVFMPTVIDNYLADDRSAIQALSDVYDWAPQIPVDLFHGRDDVTVPYLSASSTLQAMQARGAGDRVTLTDCVAKPGEPAGHAQCVLPYWRFVLDQFARAARDL